ncbi:MAG: Flp pilus assembly protein CpaB [Desulfuromonas sp.]|nr:MAG: Flp pilus assembly protein CpaB [Desulfuromonas sp.]
MKKYGALITLGLAVLFGLLAVWMTNQWLQERGSGQVATASTPVETEQVVVAATDIPLGSRLTGETLAMTEWPAGKAPRGSFNSVEELDGRVTLSRMAAGMPVLKGELADAGSGAGLVALIEPGNRAMAVRVDEVTGVGGFIIPDSMVDVISVETRGKKNKSNTVLERVRVLAIAQETETEEGKAQVVRTVTLQVKPDEAEKLALQMHVGSLHLILRNPMDDAVKEKPKVAKARPIQTLQSQVQRQKAVPFNVEIIRGSDRDSIKFKDPDSEDRY